MLVTMPLASLFVSLWSRLSSSCWLLPSVLSCLPTELAVKMEDLQMAEITVSLNKERYYYYAIISNHRNIKHAILFLADFVSNETKHDNKVAWR